LRSEILAYALRGTAGEDIFQCMKIWKSKFKWTY